MNEQNKKQVEWKMEITNFSQVKHFCNTYHYLHTTPSASMYNFLIYENDEPVGIIAYGQPVSPQTYKQFQKYGIESNKEIIELLRVAFKDHKNYLSKYLSESMKYIKENCNYKFIVSYSDLGQGHEGTLYKSSNFVKDGISKGGSWLYWEPKTQSWCAPRTFARRYWKTNGKENTPKNWKEFITSQGYDQWKQSTDKYRWLYFLDKKTRKLYIKNKDIIEEEKQNKELITQNGQPKINLGIKSVDKITFNEIVFDNNLKYEETDKFLKTNYQNYEIIYEKEKKYDY